MTRLYADGLGNGSFCQDLFDERSLGSYVLTETNTAHIFWEGNYSTTVQWYLTMHDVPTFGGSITRAFLAITDFSDKNFELAIKEWIDSWNSVNKDEWGVVEFNLWCYETGIIFWDSTGGDFAYLNSPTYNAIVASSSEDPVSLDIDFVEHAGAWCTCCNLAERVRLSSED